ncbi:class I SAM-dependent methyltransferase [Granulicella sibirica]|uniref:Biosynthesis of ubiquinone n=1 Tax=Granulicella sibirica TaxID=2479048 RepID=A0A4Q0T1K0_9BACT|nr:class I SAM-dependent methyltransferase [Granulicella sibirica]RXH57453.1 biosynthesis of ubiquinone [Granulicella sibirica]
MSEPPNFDRIARPYRWLEYFTLGPVLQQTRTHFLAHLDDRRQALILGDGDGRFTAQLLLRNPHIEADAVDTSATMLHLLAQRANAPKRLRTHHGDALTYAPIVLPDLIVTHFFLDCLTQPELDRLTHRLAQTLAPGGLWLLSDFRIPPGPMNRPARLYIAFLYKTFSLLTGLSTASLPDHTTALTQAGLVRVAHHYRLFGLLTTELWRKTQ